MVASGLTPDLVRVLRELDGSKRIEALLALAESEHVERLRGVLAGLTELGLLEEAAPPAEDRRPAAEAALWSLRARLRHRETAHRRAHSAIVVQGNGRLTVAVATLLAAAGVGRVHVDTSGQVAEADLGSGYADSDLGSARRAAAAAAVRRANPATRTARPTGRRRPDLVLLADAVVPAPEVVDLLFQDGVPHLPVRIREGLGIVGPLVLPGRTSCLRCADLHRTGFDSSWPKVAGQLAGRTQRADLGSVHATAAMAAGQALRVLSPSDLPPPVWNATVEIDTFEGTVEHRAWVPHPACDCGALPEPDR